MCTAPHNNKVLLNGISPKYFGVGGHLFAIAINESVKQGFDGVVFGYAKNPTLIEHYASKYGALHIAALHPYQFVIESDTALKIRNQYNYEEE